MSDFASYILNNEFKGNLRNCRRLIFGFGQSSVKKAIFFCGRNTFISDKFFFISKLTFETNNISNSFSDFLNHLRLQKNFSRNFLLPRKFRSPYHIFLARLLLSIDLTRKLKFLINHYRFLKNYRGFREIFCLPSRGQRTKTNASSRKLVAHKKKIKKYRRISAAMSSQNLLGKYRFLDASAFVFFNSHFSTKSSMYNVFKTITEHLEFQKLSFGTTSKMKLLEKIKKKQNIKHLDLTVIFLFSKFFFPNLFLSKSSSKMPNIINFTTELTLFIPSSTTSLNSIFKRQSTLKAKHFKFDWKPAKQPQ